MTEIELIEQIALRVGMKSLMNNGAASCVYSEGCAGVTQDHLIAFTRQIALHCAVHLVGPAQTIPPSEQRAQADDATAKHQQRAAHGFMPGTSVNRCERCGYSFMGSANTEICSKCADAAIEREQAEFRSSEQEGRL